MNGNELQQAVNVINEYIKNGNTVYLWDNKKERSCLKLNDSSKLNFALLSSIDFHIGGGTDEKYYGKEFI